MEKSNNQKQSFLYGAAWLTAAAMIVKLIGAPYKIILGNIIGDAGFSYFNTAYSVYSVLLMISTAGLPVAMSRMIAEAESQGRHNQLKRTFQAAFGIFFLLGGLGSLLMCGFPKQLANRIGQPDAWYAIAALGPSSLLLCLTSAFRGFFQGQGNMRPTSLSQVLEALCKLFIGLGLATFIVLTYHDVPLAAGGAIVGVTCGSLAAVTFMALAYRKALRRLPSSDDAPESYKTTIKKLLAVAVPITIGSAGLQLIALIDVGLNMSRLKGPCGFTQAEADTLKGIYDFAQTIFGLPCALVSPLSVSVIPAIAGLLAKREHRLVQATEESAVRTMGLITMPCAVGLFVLSEPVMALLRGYSGDSLAIAGRLLSILGICVVFNSMVLLTNSIMQAHGHASLPVINMFVGGLVKIVVNYILVGNPRIHIQGAPIGTLCCYLCITVLNVFAMRRHVERAPAVTRNLCRPLLAAVPMGLVCFAVWKALALVTDSRLFLCAVPIAVGVVVYALLVVKLRIITYADCMLLPKGEKIAKFLRLSQ